MHGAAVLVALATLLSCVSVALAGHGAKAVPDFLKVKLTYFGIRGLAEPIRLYLSSIGSFVLRGWQGSCECFCCKKTER